MYSFPENLLHLQRPDKKPALSCCPDLDLATGAAKHWCTAESCRPGAVTLSSGAFTDHDEPSASDLCKNLFAKQIRAHDSVACMDLFHRTKVCDPRCVLHGSQL